MSSAIQAPLSGRTLKQQLHEEGPLPSPQAARITADVLDALSRIHARGEWHGDIHSGNILLTQNQQTLLLTANALPTEQSPASDILAVGNLLLDMLCGEKSRDTPTGEWLTQHTDADETLATIILKASCPNAELRYPDANSMRTALLQYLDATQFPLAESRNTHSTLDFLLRRMRSKSDFPALSGIISEINHCVSDEMESTNKIAQVILQDFALTNKIIKLVNTVAYRRFGGDINTISKAVGILGLETIRNIAMTLVLLNFLQNKAQAQDLKDEAISAFLAGLIAAQITNDKRAGAAEEAMICAMFHNLGRMLAKFYFFEESREINRLMQDQHLSEHCASQKILGISYNELGAGVAGSWGLPPLLISGMENIHERRIGKPNNKDDQLRITANLANELCTLATHTEKNQKNQVIQQLITRYAASSPPSEKSLSLALEASLIELSSRAGAIGMETSGSPLLKKVRSWCGHVELETPLPEETSTSTCTNEAMQHQQENTLNAGIQDVISTLASDYLLNDVLQMILETMYRGLSFQRTLVMIRDNKKDMMSARFGFGDNISSTIPNFHFPLAFTADVFHIAIEKGLDIWIDDVSASNIADKIPDWFHKTIDTKSFLLLPIMVNKKAIGLIYADTAKSQTLKLTDTQLALLRTLRNQAVIAIKQKT